MNLTAKNTLLGALGIEEVEMKKERVVLSMPVDERTHQPLGFLHGGASVALAETAASIGSILHVDMEEYNVFGIEINANHIKAKRSGTVYGIATPTHIGKSTMVWEIKVVDEEDELICLSRCTVGVVPKKK
ncbi:esterase [Pontibacillus chungwhensis BH030062]|uniref:Esterase n=2 Tax=Pontibacillus TaxID=289201 RepID=A0A0A2UY55_9BACI|nr:MULTISPECIES: hotdog fold thioesterase [Pontibacillus]KGP91713.1 esterase [Pontibacillus chungwhensis BH030062]GGD06224.1 esterase [Pontibacillus salipaludis]